MKPIFAFVLLLVLYSCGDRTKDELSSPGVSEELAQQRRESIKNIHYTISFSIPEKRLVPIQGAIRIVFELSKPEEPVILDFNAPELNLRTVTSPIFGNVKYTHKNEHIIIDPSSLKQGINDINIVFTATELGLNRQDDYLYTLFVPDRASSVFPCFDQPDLKATYGLELEIPEDWVAVSTGEVIEEEILHGRKTISYARTLPFSTYVFSFAAGKFHTITDTRGTPPMTMYHRETDSAKIARNADEIFDLHRKAINWMERYTDILYTFGKFDFVAIPSFQYGGMEHPGTIHYRASSLWLEETATQNDYLGRASLIAHETAHMWFGNLVTMRWFDDVWMKEVFANFMADKIVNPSFPDINHDLKFLLRHYPRAYTVDRSEGANAIRQPLDNLKQAGNMYGAIIYNKAPIMMKKLERMTGEQAFQEGLKEYLEKFNLINADWNELIIILDTKTTEDLKSWSDIWIENSGMPILEVNRNNGDVTIQQRDLVNRNRLWMQELEVLTGQSSQNVLLNQDQVSLTLSNQAEFILPNGNGLEYGAFILDNKSAEYLLKEVNRFDDPYKRGLIWLDLFETMLNGGIDYGNYTTSLLESIAVENDKLLLELLLDQLEIVYWKFLDSTKQKEIGSTIETQLWAEINSRASSDLKAAFYKSFVQLTNTDDGTEKLFGLWNKSITIDGLSLAERDYMDLSLQLAIRDYENANRILNEQRDRISNEDRKKQFIFVRPASVSNPNTRDQFFLSLDIEAKRAVEPWVLEGLSLLHHPLRADYSVKYLGKSLEMLEEIQMTGDIFFPKRWLDATFSGHRSSEALKIVDDHLVQNPNLNKRLRQKILQSTDLLRRSVNNQAPTL